MAPPRGSNTGDRLVPITREYLRAFYAKHPLEAVPHQQLALHTTALRGLEKSLQLQLPAGGSAFHNVPLPAKIDDALWRSRQLCEEAASSLSRVAAGTADKDCKDASAQCRTALLSACAQVLAVQEANTNAVKLQLARFIPADFRGTMVKKAQEVKEAKNKKAVDDLIRKGGSIRQRYELYLQQQWERRQSLVELGNASGMYRFLIKYLGGVPSVLLDFAKEINAKLGPMEEQRLKYGPDLYAITSLGIQINGLAALWAQDPGGLSGHADSMRQVVLPAVQFYVLHMTRIVTFIGKVFAISPFFVTAEQLAHGEGEEGEHIADDCSCSTSTSEGVTALVEVLQISQGDNRKSAGQHDQLPRVSRTSAQAHATRTARTSSDHRPAESAATGGHDTSAPILLQPTGSTNTAAAMHSATALPAIPTAAAAPSTATGASTSSTSSLPTLPAATLLPSTSLSRSEERGTYSARPSSTAAGSSLPPILTGNSSASGSAAGVRPERNSHSGGTARPSSSGNAVGIGKIERTSYTSGTGSIHSNRPSNTGNSGVGAKVERTSHTGARPSTAGSYWSAQDQQEWDEEEAHAHAGGSPGSGMLGACLPGWPSLVTLSGGSHGAGHISNKVGLGGESPPAEGLRPIGE